MLAEVERLPLDISDLHDARLPHLTNATKYAPSTGSWLQRRARTFDLQDGRHTVFIIICLCYEGLEWPGGGRMDVVGPKHDLLLLLSHLQYRHLDENREFLIFTDFEVDFVDHTGSAGAIRRIPATRHNISTCVQATMQDLEREDKCVLYYSGHIELGKHKTHGCCAHMLLQDKEQIYDHELRGWLQQSRFSTTSIIAILDACYSGGFLGLPYVHTKNAGHMSKVEPAYGDQMKSQVIEIASTAKHQLSFGKKFKRNQDSETVHGILTWHLLQYLQDNPQHNLHDLVSHIYSRCDTPWVDTDKQQWRQVPVLSCSSKIGGGTAFLELR